MRPKENPNHHFDAEWTQKTPLFSKISCMKISRKMTRDGGTDTFKRVEDTQIRLT